MDRDELAKKIRENIFDHCGHEGHASKEVIERAIIDSLGKHLVKDSIRDVYTLTEAQPACPTVQQIKTQQPWPGPYRGMRICVGLDPARKYWSKG